MHPNKPRKPDATDFETEFTGVDGAGFFPGAGGYFHGCDGAPREPWIVFMGSDFGAFKKWSETVKPAGGEDPERQTTLKAVRELVDEVARQTDVAADTLRSRCYLTNAVLALAKVGGNMQTSEVYRNPDHRDYLRECGEEYRRWFGEPKRARSLVVLGDVHVKLYGCRIWSRVWPDLFGPDGLW